MSQHITGIAASNGYALAPAYLLSEPDLSFNTTTVDDTNAEKTRLDQALADAIADIETIKSRTSKNLSDADAQVFEAHIMMLQDPDFIGGIKNDIDTNKTNAEAALNNASQHFISLFKSMTDNAYMQQRATDIKDVSKRVMAHLLNVELPSPALIDTEVVLVSDDLTPTETAQLDKRFVKAFVTNLGARTSHSAIMARTLEIPAVTGTDSITSQVSNGQLVAVDGNKGEVIIEPTQDEKTTSLEAAQAFEEQKQEWASLKTASTQSKDGKHVTLAANIGKPKDTEGANDNGAEAIGLFRTEFLYMDSNNFPSEDTQFAAYKASLESMKGQQVVIRTMDIGGDKKLSYFSLPDEMNPFLGWRALRVSLSEQGESMFRTQLRALLRASVFGKLGIMFPMVAALDEFRRAKGIYEEEKDKLTAAGVAVAEDIQVGIMIEIPAAAILADKFAKEVDFFSIGTNDLIQYSFAADRGNEHVSYLYQPCNPSLLRLINNVIQASHKEGKWTGMCGEMAGDQTAVPLLLGMGLDEFSMSATSILQTRSLIKRLDSTRMRELSDKAISECSTVDEVIALVQQYTA